MKRSLIALSLAALATVSFAAMQPAPDEFRSDRTLPTYPEVGFDGWRNNAGESEKDNFVQTQVGSIDGYRNHAGESEKDNVVQTQVG